MVKSPHRNIPENRPINIYSGWNWIGYIPSSSLDVSDALDGAYLVEQDYIKSQMTSAIYYDGYGFYPGFNMTPTSGYMLKSANASSFFYPDEALGRNYISIYDYLVSENNFDYYNAIPLKMLARV